MQASPITRFCFTGVGLGKTHLMQAVGNQIQKNSPGKTIGVPPFPTLRSRYGDGAPAGHVQDFMNYYRSVDALLIDDIPDFFAKLRSQEEFFHVFNALLERGHQMVLTCDRYPGNRRFGGRLEVAFHCEFENMAVEPPELEHRVAILLKKAEQEGVELPSDVAFL